MKTIILFLLFLPFYLSSQTSSFEISGGALLGYRILTGEHASLQLFFDRKEEIPSLGFNLGLAGNFPLDEKNVLKIGARLAAFGYQTKLEENTSFSHGPDRERIAYQYQFLEIPIGFRLQSPKDGFYKFQEIGVVTAFYINSSTIFYPDGIKFSTDIVKESREEIKYIQAGFYFAYGFAYRIPNVFEYFVQPVGRVNFIPNRFNDKGKDFLISLGLETGLRFGF
ncbi:MAG: hypothetical protein R2879_22250 [Saprospiraceae bacterium]